MNTKKFLLYSSPLLVLFLAFSVFEPFLFQNFFASTDLNKLKGKEFKIIAHRGASGHAPENTLVAFQKALDMNADIIALDVRMSKDNQVVVIHDEMVNRTTNGSGDVHDFTLAQLKSLDAGSWFSADFAGEKIPTLKEALDLIDGKAECLIEIKHADHAHYDGIAKKIVDIVLQEEDGIKWCVLESYEGEYLEEAHDYLPEIKTKRLVVGEDSAPLIAFYIETKVYLGRSNESKHEDLDALNPHYSTLSERRVFRMHARGYEVYTFLINDIETMIKMLNMGVDGIFTDYPDKLYNIRQQIEKL
ncbi:MAG TPA: glycerophosphodiester phosphodiesterase [Cyclobacteriaceae bacterium]